MASPDPRDAPAGIPPPALLRLLIVDADRRVRASLAGLLDLADHVEVVGSVGHARSALQTCEACRPDAVVIDPRLPDLPDGLAFIRGLRAAQPGVRVVVVAWSPALATLLGDDPGIQVVSPDEGDLADRILEAVRLSAGPDRDPPPDADAILGGTA